MQRWLVGIALALIASLFVIGTRKDRTVEPSASESSGGPMFNVGVGKPRFARPSLGLVLSSLFGSPANLEFADSSPGAEVSWVGFGRLELRADGWELRIETDGVGRIASEMRLVFSSELGGREQTLRCRPSEPPQSPIASLRERVGLAGKAPDGEDPATGYLEVREGSESVGGRFRLELGTYENASTGKTINWPPAPLVVSASFDQLPLGSR